jgi:hypothetical protein
LPATTLNVAIAESEFVTAQINQSYYLTANGNEWFGGFKSEAQQVDDDA